MLAFLISIGGVGIANSCLAQEGVLPTVTEVVPLTTFEATFPVSFELPVSPKQGLTIEALEALALQCHPSVQRAKALANAARGRALQAGLPPNPSVGFEGQQLGSDGRAEQYGIAMGQEWVVRDKLSLNRSTIFHEVRQLEQEVIAVQQRVVNDVRVGFYRVLRAQEQIGANRQLVELSEKGLAIAEALFQAQEVGRIDSLQAGIEVEAAKIQLDNAENRLKAAWQALTASCAKVDLPYQPLIGNLVGPTQVFDFEQELVRLQQQSPELFAIAASIDRARTNLRRQQIENRPNVNMQGLVNWRDNGTDGDPNAAVAVSIPLPLRNQNQGAIQEARHQVYAAEWQLTQQQMALRQRLADVFERYHNAQQQVARYRDAVLPKAEETLSLVRQAYQAGEINFIALLTAQRTYIQSRLAYLESLESLRIAEIEIQGLLLRDSLKSE